MADHRLLAPPVPARRRSVLAAAWTAPFLVVAPAAPLLAASTRATLAATSTADKKTTTVKVTIGADETIAAGQLKIVLTVTADVWQSAQATPPAGWTLVVSGSTATFTHTGPVTAGTTLTATFVLSRGNAGTSATASAQLYIGTSAVGSPQSINV